MLKTTENKRRRMLASLAILLISSAFSAAWADSSRIPGAPYPVRHGSTVQLAILLDTSNSMDGLINQAKSQLWKVVNELARATREGEHPTLQVALYQYGNNGLQAGGGWIEQVLPFTTDLDRVSQKLFSLSTNGGEEYCGWVMRSAVEELSWDMRPDVYKVIFIAGNEPFTQGPVRFEESVAEARRKGVVINTIFCGNRQEGISTQWAAGAELAGGQYLSIDQDAAVVAVATPQDGEIEQLGYSLNQTYVPYGSDGFIGASAQREADRGAMIFAPAAAPVERAVFKSSRQYGSASWDAATQVAQGKVSVDELKTENLPLNLRNKSKAELKAYLDAQIRRRGEIQDKISALSAARQAFLAKQVKNSSGKLSLDSAMMQAVHMQAEQKNFSFKQ